MNAEQLPNFGELIDIYPRNNMRRGGQNTELMIALSGAGKYKDMLVCVNTVNVRSPNLANDNGGVRQNRPWVL